MLIKMQAGRKMRYGSTVSYRVMMRDAKEGGGGGTLEDAAFNKTIKKISYCSTRLWENVTQACC